MFMNSNWITVSAFPAPFPIALALVEGGTVAQQTVVIEMNAQNSFKPRSGTIQAGDTVEWRTVFGLGDTDIWPGNRSRSRQSHVARRR